MRLILPLLLLLISLPGFTQGETDTSFDSNIHTEIDLQAELNKLGYKELDATSLMDENVVKLMRKAIKQSALHDLSQDEVSKLILERAEGSSVHEFLAGNPKLVNALADILRDEKALSEVLGLFLRKDDLRMYFFIWIGFLIIGYTTKKIVINKNWHKLKQLFAGLAVSLVFSLGSLATFYIMFEDEISPSAKILVQHWKKY